MRADRLISILLWLQVHGVTSTDELARRMEVSPRTIHRDMDALTTAGIPVFALRGRNGGWALPEEYRRSATWLSADEVRTLALLGPAHLLSDLNMSGTASAAWLKLLASLPPPHRDEATLLKNRILIDQSTWRPRTELVPALPILKQAVMCERLVEMRYDRADGDSLERTVAPLGLVAKGTTWYVVALAGDDVRTYRVSRIGDARLLDATFARPDDFDLAAFWEASKASFVRGLPQYPVTLRVDADAVDALSGHVRWGKVQRVGPAADDGRHEMRVLFEVIEDALAMALGLGARVEVMEPEELRVAVVASLHGALDRYSVAHATTGPATSADVTGRVSDGQMATRPDSNAPPRTVTTRS